MVAAYPSGNRGLLWPLGGILALFSWSCAGLLVTDWQQDAYAHGPLVAAVFVYLVFKTALTLSDDEPSNLGAGLLFVVLGGILYVIGRSQNIGYLHVPGLGMLFLANLLTIGGWGLVRRFVHPLLLILLLIPIPSPILDLFTGPLRYWTSVAAEHLLHLAEYPVARNGVVISIGQYQLLVAEACSGLNSAISIIAVVIVYLSMTTDRGLLRCLLLAASAIPIALFANLIRVFLLAMITYHFGDDAGQGFLHAATGYLLYLLGIALVLLLERALGVFKREATPLLREAA